MKRTLLLSFCIIAVSLVSSGQIVITSGDIIPIGTTINYATDTLPGSGIVPGEPGENVTWDFTGVNQDITYTFDLVDPSSTPYGSEFPGANYGSHSSSDTVDIYSYQQLNSDKLTEMGFVVASTSFTLPWHIVPGDVMLDFPVEYQNSYAEVYTEEAIFPSPQPGADSVLIRRTTNEQTMVDAWGTLTLPSGSYNVLRQKSELTGTDSTFVKIGGNWIFLFASQSYSTNYSWWTNDNNAGFQVFDMSMDETGQVGDVAFLLSTTVGVEENNIDAARVYPNPVNDALFVEFDEPVNGEMTVLNVQGQVLARQNAVNTQIIRLNVSELPEGVYIYRFTDSKGNPGVSGKFMKR